MISARGPDKDKAQSIEQLATSAMIIEYSKHAPKAAIRSGSPLTEPYSLVPSFQGVVEQPPCEVPLIRQGPGTPVQSLISTGSESILDNRKLSKMFRNF